jgi:hypothetical protein
MLELSGKWYLLIKFLINFKRKKTELLNNNSITNKLNIDINERVAFLNRIHLFNGLSDDQFQILGEALTEARYPSGTEIIKQGAEIDCLYLIWTGKVTVIQSEKEQPLTTIGVGDHFGEDSMLLNPYKMDSTFKTAEETIVFLLRREQFLLLVKQISGLKTNFEVMVNSHRLEKHIHFSWLQNNETINFLTRKHSILLVQGLVGPILLLTAATIGMLGTWYYSFWFPGLAALWYISLFAFLGAVGWGVWNGIDWSNDYYIITDQRVVLVEKVI